MNIISLFASTYGFIKSMASFKTGAAVLGVLPVLSDHVNISSGVMSIPSL